MERLLLPAIPQLLETWTGSFDFTVMSNSDRLELVENNILSFQGTTMCQKILNVACSSPQDHNAPSISNSERVGWAEHNILSSDETTTSVKVMNNACDGSEFLNMMSNSVKDLAEHSTLCSQETRICQKVSISMHSHQEDLNGFSLTLC